MCSTPVEAAPVTPVRGVKKLLLQKSNSNSILWCSYNYWGYMNYPFLTVYQLVLLSI